MLIRLTTRFLGKKALKLWQMKVTGDKMVKLHLPRNELLAECIMGSVRPDCTAEHACATQCYWREAWRP
jgi:hypothetical protein